MRVLFFIMILVLISTAFAGVIEYTGSGQFVESNMPAIVLGPYWWDNFYMLNDTGYIGGVRPYTLGDAYDPLNPGDYELTVCDATHDINNGMSSAFDDYYDAAVEFGVACDSEPDCAPMGMFTPLNDSATRLLDFDFIAVPCVTGASTPPLIYTTTPQAYVGFGLFAASAWTSPSETLLKNAIEWAWDNRV